MIAFDNSQDNSGNFINYTATSYTCSGNILIVGVAGTGSQGQITGCNYNGVAMTQIDVTTTSAGRFLYLFYLLNPAQGANNVQIQGAGGSGIGACFASYKNTQQSGQPDSESKSGNTNTTYTTPTTVIASNCWGIAYVVTNGDVTPTGSGVTTTVRNSTHTGSAGALADSNGVIATGVQTMGMTGSSAQWGLIVASIAPGPSGAWLGKYIGA